MQTLTSQVALSLATDAVVYPMVSMVGQRIHLSSSDTLDGHWVTIGSHSADRDDEPHGGAHVFIRDGQILKGPKSLTGKSIGQLKSHAGKEKLGGRGTPMDRTREKLRKLNAADPKKIAALADLKSKAQAVHSHVASAQSYRQKESAARAGGDETTANVWGHAAKSEEADARGKWGLIPTAHQDVPPQEWKTAIETHGVNENPYPLGKVHTPEAHAAAGEAGGRPKAAGYTKTENPPGAVKVTASSAASRTPEFHARVRELRGQGLDTARAVAKARGEVEAKNPSLKAEPVPPKAVRPAMHGQAANVTKATAAPHAEPAPQGSDAPATDFHERVKQLRGQGRSMTGAVVQARSESVGRAMKAAAEMSKAGQTITNPAQDAPGTKTTERPPRSGSVQHAASMKANDATRRTEYGNPDKHNPDAHEAAAELHEAAARLYQPYEKDSTGVPIGFNGERYLQHKSLADSHRGSAKLLRDPNYGKPPEMKTLGQHLKSKAGQEAAGGAQEPPKPPVTTDGSGEGEKPKEKFRGRAVMGPEKQFVREGKNAARVGEVFKDKSGQRHIVTKAKSGYASEDYIEDNDDWAVHKGGPGHYTYFSARPVEHSKNEKAADAAEHRSRIAEANAKEKAENYRKFALSQLQASNPVKTEIGPPSDSKLEWNTTPADHPWHGIVQKIAKLPDGREVGTSTVGMGDDYRDHYFLPADVAHQWSIESAVRRGLTAKDIEENSYLEPSVREAARNATPEETERLNASGAKKREFHQDEYHYKALTEKLKAIPHDSLEYDQIEGERDKLEAKHQEGPYGKIYRQPGPRSNKRWEEFNRATDNETFRNPAVADLARKYSATGDASHLEEAKGIVAKTKADDEAEEKAVATRRKSEHQKSSPRRSTPESSSIPTRQVQTKYGQKHVHSFELSHKFWSERKAGNLPSAVSVSKNPKTGAWEGAIWGKTPEEVAQHAKSLAAKGIHAVHFSRDAIELKSRIARQIFAV